jgi:hypothetical protein
MPTSRIQVTEGSGKNIATHSVSEDAVTKEIQRVVVNDSAGADVGIATQTTLSALNDKVTACNTGAVAGTVTANLGTIADVATQTTLNSLNGKVTACNTGAVTVSSMPTTTVTGPLTDTQLRATAVPVSLASVPSHAVTNAGTFAVQVTSAPTTAVTGTFWQTTQPVSGTVTANAGTNLNTSALALETGGNLAAIKAKTDNITACNTGAVVLAAGTAEIGKLGAGTAAIGTVGVTSLASGKTILRAVISGATSGNNTIVAAAGGALKIKVLSVMLVATGAVTVAFQSGAGGTALTGTMSLDAKSGFVLPAPADPNCHWFETAGNALLNMSLGGAVQVSGCITYYTEA